MESGRVAVPVSAPVADPLQLVGEVSERAPPGPAQAHQNNDVLDQRYAVESAQVDDKLLRSFLLQRILLIGCTDQMKPELYDSVGDRQVGEAVLTHRSQNRLTDLPVCRQKNHSHSPSIIPPGAFLSQFARPGIRKKYMESVSIALTFFHSNR